MPAPSRFKNVLVMTPDGLVQGGQGYYTRVLRKRSDSVIELDFIPTFKRLGIHETLKLITKTVVENKIDAFFILFYGDSFLVPLEYLQKLRKKTKIVLFPCDDEMHFDTHSKYYAQAADAVITTDYFSAFAYEKLGIPAIADMTHVSKELLKPLNLTRDIDVSFVGHCAKTDRKDYMDFLEANGIKVERFGFGSSNGFVTYEEYGKIFCRSKINLNFSRLEFADWLHKDDPIIARTKGNKGRVMEVSLTRSFCLSEHYAALPHVFERGREIDWFTDRESLLEKVRYYLAHDAEREQIAQRAYERTLREYEDGPYFDKVMAWLMPVLYPSSPVNTPPAVLYKSPGFKRRQINDLVFHGLSLLMNRRFGACAQIIPSLFQYGLWTFVTGTLGGLKRSWQVWRAL